MWYKLNKTKSKAILEEINSSYAYPVNSFCRQYTELIEHHDFDYLIADGYTSSFDFEFIEIIEELPYIHPIHYSLKYQIIFTQVDSLRMLQQYPEIGMYCKKNDIPTCIENGYVYIYVEYMLPEHLSLFNAFNAIINEKS